MTEHRTADELLALLRADLQRLGPRFDDEKFCRELYRGLTNRALRRRDEDDGAAHLTLSWKRAEELINELRRERGREPLVLAQTGHEGELDPTVASELERLGWESVPAPTDHFDAFHVWSPEDPPPPDTGKRFAPAPPKLLDEEEAHRRADQERRRVAR
jgi:5-formyltetrahydrofolate cyclo-ligase